MKVTFPKHADSTTEYPAFDIQVDGVHYGMIIGETWDANVSSLSRPTRLLVHGYTVEVQSLDGETGAEYYFRKLDGESPLTTLARARAWARETVKQFV